MGHVRKRVHTRSNGSQVTRYQARWIDADGKERARSFRRKSHADTWLAKVEAEIATGPTRERVTVATWLDRWLDLVAARVAAGQLAPRTAQGYESHVRVHLAPALGEHELHRLTVRHVETFLGGLQRDGLTANTARSIRATLSIALNDAMRDELIDRNVAKIARPPKVRKRRISAFTVDELRALLAACETHRLGPMFVFAALTGARASELRGLRWTDVDLDTGTFEINQTIHRITAAAARVVPRTGLVTSDPKTEASSTQIPLADAAVALLHLQHQHQQTEREAAHVWRDTGHVFTTTIGTPLEPSAVNREWRRLVENAGVDYHTPEGQGRGLHELRRSFTTLLRTLGAPLEDVQALGRWASPQTLLGHYTATTVDRLRDAANAAADQLGLGPGA